MKILGVNDYHKTITLLKLTRLRTKHTLYTYCTGLIADHVNINNNQF